MSYNQLSYFVRQHLPPFCPDQCKFLSITESEQNRTEGKPEHRCLKYNKRLIHGICHPYIMRCEECVKYKIVEWGRILKS
jgi:hypothetical protein